MEDLGNNRNDYLVALTKAITSLIPNGGSIIGEIIGNVVPNQRIDRIAKYVKELDARLSQISTVELEKLLTNAEFVDLLEEGFFQASRAITEERRNHILNIITNGINVEDIELIQSKYLLKLLNELNDIEVIWLRYYQDTRVTADEEFREKNKEILNQRKRYQKKSEKELIDYLLQDGYTEHLERLGLINKQIKINKKSGMPDFNRLTGKPEIRNVNITSLGTLLLQQLELIEKSNLVDKFLPNIEIRVFK